jgi:ABC-type multidrug transport system ATPase subunit
MLSFEHVDKRFANKVIFSQFSYHFNHSHYCIAGINGIGKTTLLLMAAGIEKADKGDITLNHLNVFDVNAKKDIGISSDKVLLPEFLTAQQLINFHCQQHQIPFPENLLTSLNFTAQLRNKVSELSLGNSKKLSLILALSHQPKCLLLDEPSTGLDHDSREWLLDYLHGYTNKNTNKANKHIHKNAENSPSKRQIIVTSHEDDFLKDLSYTQLSFSELIATNTTLNKV